MTQEEYMELNAALDAVAVQDVHLGRALSAIVSHLPGYSEAAQEKVDADAKDREEAEAEVAKAEEAAPAEAPAEQPAPEAPAEEPPAEPAAPAEGESA